MANTKIPSELSSTPSISDSGDATAITINSSEEVSIGTTTTFSNPLTTNQSGGAAGALRNQVAMTHTGASTAYHLKTIRASGTDEPAGLAFVENTTERMRINSSGHVGIGTTSPTTAKVVIAHDNSTIALHTTGGYNYQAKFESTDAEAGIVLADSNSTGNYNRIGVVTNDMRFITNNSEQMRIDSSGNITTPNNPAFDVSDSNGTSQGNTKAFGTVYVNKGSHYSTSNGRFTAPIAGTYLFYTSYIKNGSLSVHRRGFVKNGSTTMLHNSRQLRLDQDGSGGQQYGDNGYLIAMVTLAANDYIQVYQQAGNSYGAHEYEVFGGYLIG